MYEVSRSYISSVLRSYISEVLRYLRARTQSRLSALKVPLSSKVPALRYLKPALRYLKALRYLNTSDI